MINQRSFACILLASWILIARRATDARGAALLNAASLTAAEELQACLAAPNALNATTFEHFLQGKANR